MDIKYERSGTDIINKCLAIISKPKLVVIDTQSTSYQNNRVLIDKIRERKLLSSQIDDAVYYDELMK